MGLKRVVRIRTPLASLVDARLDDRASRLSLLTLLAAFVFWLAPGCFDNSELLAAQHSPAVAAPGAVVDVSTFSPSSPPARSVRDVFYLVLGIAFFIFLLVEGVLIYSLFRFRARDERKKAEPPQVYGSKPIEVAWTVGPALIVFVLFLVVVRAVAEIKPPPQVDNPLRVTVVGHQWWWEFRYHRDGELPAPDNAARSTTPLSATDAPWPPVEFITANELVVPRGRTVQLRLESADVVHSFWVPRLAGKTDVVPGHPNLMWFIAEEPIWYEGQCAEYCGTQHAKMLLRVQAQEAADFDRWLAHQRSAATESSFVNAGKQMFLGMACINCHRIRGTVAKGSFGPDLTHLMSRETIASGILRNNRENLLAWLRDPDQFKPGCYMPNMTLSEAQLQALSDYLSSLK